MIVDDTRYEPKKLIGGLFQKYEDYLLSLMWIRKRQEWLHYCNPNCQLICGYYRSPRCSICNCSRKAIAYKYEHNSEYCKNKSICNKKEHFNKIYNIQKGKKLVVHHITYKRVCNEKKTDCCVVCEECHKEIHSDINHPLNPDNFQNKKPTR